MAGKKRPRRERTHDWQQIQQYTLWPEQKVYELLRPVVLFQEDAAERARETGAAERTLQRKADQFEQHGMISLFPKAPAQPSETSRSFPPDMRQFIVDLHAEYAAFSTAGIPKAIVSDGGGIFYANQAMSVYQALGIEKKRIDPKQAWQNYIETMFNIVRRMADYFFHQARSWEEMQHLHRTWVQDYNSQRHWAHEQRDDGCHSPAQVIGWHKGTMVPEETLNRILFATRYTRHLDRHGYIRFSTPFLKMGKVSFPFLLPPVASFPHLTCASAKYLGR